MKTFCFIVISLVLCLTRAVAATDSEQNQIIQLKGTIGKFKLRMEVSVVNNLIIGWYDYMGESTKLRIDGVLKKDGSIQLKEYNYRAEITGVFDGNLKGSIISGVWKNPTQTKLLPFKLDITRGDLYADYFDTPAITQTQDSTQLSKERLMYRPSKVKGFSKLALWVTIGLILTLVLTIVFLLKGKNKALEQQQLMFQHTKKEHYSSEHVPPPSSNTKTGARIGYEFEKMVVDLFSQKYFTLKHWSSDKTSNNHASAEASKYPDLLIEYKRNDLKRSFAVECKYRSSLTPEGFVFDEEQLNNYRTFESENDVKVFVIIGVAGSPSNPKDLYVMPLSDIKTANVSLSQLKLRYKKHEKSQLFYNYEYETLTIWNKEIDRS
jgi:hypothetical protein